MKSRDSLIRLKRFQVDEKRRQVAQIEAMIADFNRMVSDLDDQIVSEQNRVGIHDITHFAYPTFAKAAIQRRENLKVSIHDLEVKLEAARDELSGAVDRKSTRLNSSHRLTSRMPSSA
jgi:hypothetical protein